MGLQLLIADDSRVSRMVLKNELLPVIESHSAEIKEASTGREALKYCREKKYDAVFLDLTMPDMTGYQVLEALKKEGIAQTVIVFSADIQPDAEKVVKELGAVEFMKKPLEREKYLPVEMLKKLKVI